MPRTIIFSAVLLMFISQIAYAQSGISDSTFLQLQKGSYTIPFIWAADSSQTPVEPYSAILVPVHIKNSKLELYMQFDLGSPTTFFYSASLAQLDKNLRYKKDSSAVAIARFKIGNMALPQFLPVKKHGGMMKDNRMIIGTIGTDMLNEKITQIDYPEQRLMLHDSLPTALAGQDWHPLVYVHGSILLPAEILGNPTMLFFDTGSSAYELLTSKIAFDHLATADAPVSSNPVNSWGHQLVAHTAITKDSITIGSTKMALKKVTYVEGASQSQIARMMQAGIGGMTGNTLFLQKTLLLDLRRKRFSILQ